MVIGILFLEETHEEKKYRRDPGLEAGKWILSKVTRCAESKLASEKGMDMDDEAIYLLSNDDSLPGYRTNDSCPSTPSMDPQAQMDLQDACSAIKSKPAATKAFTKQVVLNIVGYGILA